MSQLPDETAYESFKRSMLQAWPRSGDHIESIGIETVLQRVFKEGFTAGMKYVETKAGTKWPA